MIRIEGSEHGVLTAAQSWSWYVGLAQLDGFPVRMRGPMVDFLRTELQRFAVASRRNEWRWKTPIDEDEGDEGEAPAEGLVSPAA